MADYTYTYSTSSLNFASASASPYPFAVLFNTGSNKVYLDKVLIINKPTAALVGMHQVWEAYRCIDTGSSQSGSFNLIKHDSTNPNPDVVVYSIPSGVTITGSCLFAYNNSSDEATQNVVKPMYENYGTGYAKRITLNQNEGIIFTVYSPVVAYRNIFTPYITINVTQ